jgi:hypothetical protein
MRVKIIRENEKSIDDKTTMQQTFKGKSSGKVIKEKGNNVNL